MAEMQLKLGGKVTHGTNILDITVPKELDRSVPTGLPYVDAALGGSGFTPSTALFFTGTPGAGKTTMMLQTANAITKQGHICLYNGNEEAVVQMRKTVRRLDLKDGFIVANDRLVPDVIAHAKELQRKAKGKKAKDGSPVQVFVIIDSLATMDDGKYADGTTNSKTPVRVIEQMTSWAKEKNHGQYGVCIIIGHVNKAGEFAGKQTIIHDVDAHMHLRLDTDANSDTRGFRLLEMRKNRFGAGADALCLVMGERGLSEEGSI